jgi:hypothetical protein
MRMKMSWFNREKIIGVSRIGLYGMIDWDLKTPEDPESEAVILISPAFKTKKHGYVDGHQIEKAFIYRSITKKFHFVSGFGRCNRTPFNAMKIKEKPLSSVHKTIDDAVKKYLDDFENASVFLFPEMMASSSVTTNKISNSAIYTSKIAASSITTTLKIADSAVCFTSSKPF